MEDNLLMEDNLRSKMIFDGRRPFMDDNLWLKTTFDGRIPLMEGTFWWKKTFDGRQPSMEDNLWWKTTLDGRQLLWKRTFDIRRPSIQDILWLKTTFHGRRPLIKDDHWWKMTFIENDCQSNWGQLLIEDKYRQYLPLFLPSPIFNSLLYQSRVPSPSCLLIEPIYPATHHKFGESSFQLNW